MFLRFVILAHKGEQGKGEWSRAKASRVRASGARASEAISWQGQRRKSKKRVTSKDSRFHHHPPNFYDFSPRATAPFTGKNVPVGKVKK